MLQNTSFFINGDHPEDNVWCDNPGNSKQFVNKEEIINNDFKLRMHLLPIEHVVHKVCFI